MIRIRRILFFMTFACAVALAQQTLVLNSGVQLHGRFDGGNADKIYFIDEHGNRHNFDITEITSLVFNGPEAAETGVSERYAPPAEFAERGFADTDVEPEAGWTRSAVIPAGAVIAVRTIDPIHVRRPDPRQHFLATVEQDVLDADGRVAIPRGAMAHLIVHEVSDGDVAVDLRSVGVGGRRYVLNSENIINARVSEGPGANRRTAKFVGGSALLGTIIGALGGGGKGAAVGALAGGAAGAGAQVLTRGHGVDIPPETVLSFRLDQPVSLYY